MIVTRQTYIALNFVRYYSLHALSDTLIGSDDPTHLKAVHSSRISLRVICRSFRACHPLFFMIDRH